MIRQQAGQGPSRQLGHSPRTGGTASCPRWVYVRAIRMPGCRAQTSLTSPPPPPRPAPQTTPSVTSASSSDPIMSSCSSCPGCLRSCCPCLISRCGMGVERRDRVPGWSIREVRGGDTGLSMSPPSVYLCVRPDFKDHPRAPQDGHPPLDPARARGLPLSLLTAWRAHGAHQLLPQPLPVRPHHPPLPNKEKGEAGSAAIRSHPFQSDPMLSSFCLDPQKLPPGAPGAGHAHPPSVGGEGPLF